MIHLVEAPNRVETVRSTGSPSLEVQQGIHDLQQAKWDLVAELLIVGYTRAKINDWLRLDPRFAGVGISLSTMTYIRKELQRKQIIVVMPRKAKTKAKG